MSWLYGMSPGKLTNNDFVASNNVNLYRHFPGFYYWGLVNYTTSYSLNIKRQGQAGVGVAYNIIDNDSAWLNISNGLLGETSRIVEKDSTITNYQTLRNSLRVQFSIDIGDRLSFRTGNIFQPSLKYLNDHIFSTDSELTYRLWKGLSINTRFLYNRVTRTEKENMILTYGLDYRRYF